MKKKIKILKKSLTESKEKIPMDETTLPPKGANSVPREPTQKMGPDTKISTYDVPKDVRDQIQQMLDASKQDPTQKIPMTDRVMNWLRSLFAPDVKSYSDEEVDAAVAAHNKKALAADAVKPDFSGPQPKYPSPADIPAAPDVPIGEPEPIEQPVEPEEEIDFDAFLQEVTRRHFKKRK